jgi:hypothetical protein
VSYRANSPASREAIAPALEFQSVDSHRWQSHIEPTLAELAATAGTRLQRHRAKIGRWVLEYVGDDAAACQFFAHHWPAARAGETPDAYCYHFGDDAGDSRLQTTHELRDRLPHCTICPASLRAFLRWSNRYAHVYELCHAILGQLCAHAVRINRSGRVQRPNKAWLLLRAACVEYQPSAGATRTVVLLGDRSAETSAYGYGLCLARPGNASLSDDLTCICLGTCTAHRTESHFWWPLSTVAIYPHLAPFFATSPSEGFELSNAVAEKVRNCRDAADLTRAVESGQFPESLFTELTDDLSRADDAYAMIDLRHILGPDRYLDESPLTDAVCITRDADSCWILRIPSDEEFVSHAIAAGARTSTQSTLQSAQRACLTQLLNESNIRPALLNRQLPAAQTQFCLRHYLEGHCDSITRLTAGDFADTALLQAMRLDIRRCNDPCQKGHSALSFYHGTQRVHLVSFAHRGTPVEVVAFAHAENGYAQVRAVWPGQIADFFSRHAALHVRELFTETRNSPPPRDDLLTTCR